VQGTNGSSAYWFLRLNVLANAIKPPGFEYDGSGVKGRIATECSGCVAWRICEAALSQRFEAGMTKEQVESAQRELERLLKASRLTDEIDEQRRLANEYHRLWRKIRPFVEGKEPYSDGKDAPTK
jgi:hypothetical protein